MPTVHLVERDPTLREWCRLHLSAQGYSVATFEDGRRALEAVRLEPPDLLVIATDLPAASAFALVAAIRSNVRTALTPTLFVVPAHDPEVLAQAISVEPHAVITKPMSHGVLLDAVASRLATASAGSVLRHHDTESAGTGRNPEGAGSGLVTDARNASVLVVVLRNFVSLARAFNTRSLDSVLRRFTTAARDAIVDQAGWIARADATGFVALFEDVPRAERTHAARAIEASLGVVLAARRVKRWAESALPDVALPELSVGCGIHTGEVIIARLSTSGPLGLTLAGQTPELAQRLDGRAKGLGWSVAASESALFLAGARFQTGRRASLTDTDHAVTIPIAEVLGFNPGAAKPGELPIMAEVREAVLANTMLATLAGDADPGVTDRTILVSSQRWQGDAVPELPDRKLGRRLGQGAFVTTYSAVHLPTSREEAVKVVRLRDAHTGFVEPYLEEYRKIADLEQRNVMSIFEVGRTSEVAYVAAELLPGEPLTESIRKKLPVGLALNSLAQMCLALDALHGLGVIHGDLQAKHFLSRKDRVLVLADINSSERVSLAVGLATPGRDSRQVARALPTQRNIAAPRGDFRALGVILHAMLSGDTDLEVSREEGWRAGDLTARTRLPLPLSPLQPCLDGLLGVGAAKPFERVEDVLVELLAVKEIFPFDLRYTDTDPGLRLRKA